MGHFAHASFQKQPGRPGLAHWRGPKAEAPAWKDVDEDEVKKYRPLKVIAAILCFLIPGERLEGQELPQRITSEAVNTDLQPFPALRGCCGEPTEFRWLFLDSEKAVAGQPFRTMLARPAACDALRVGVDLSGKAHLSGAFLPFSWRLGQLEFHIENEFAEAGPDFGIGVGISCRHPERWWKRKCGLKVLIRRQTSSYTPLRFTLHLVLCTVLPFG
eukprot:symbB.v1.2.025225.t1/scaffold2429.1/size79298/5